MESAVQGTLEQVFEFMDFLRARRETGRLNLYSGDKSIELYLQDGQLVHASSESAQGDDAVYEALSWDEGRFEFSAEVQTEARTIDQAEEMLLKATIRHVKGGSEDAVNGKAGTDKPRPEPRRRGGGLETIALPQGKSLHENLKSAFVDVSRLVDDLSGSKFSGYLTMKAGGDREGLVLFFHGLMSDVYSYRGGHVTVGEAGLDQILEDAQREDALISVRELEDDFVASYAALFYGRELHSGLDAKAVKIRNMVESLEADGLTGCVHVQTGEEHVEGFIFLNEGRQLGSYYREGSELVSGVTRIYQMTSEPGATIRVLETPSMKEVEADAVVQAVSIEKLDPLLEATQRCVRGISEIAGAGMASEFFQESKQAAQEDYPWLELLHWGDDGQITLQDDEFPALPLEDLVAGFLSVMEGCLQQGNDLLGAKMARAQVTEDLHDLRPDLVELGVPEGWPDTG